MGKLDGVTVSCCDVLSLSLTSTQRPREPSIQERIEQWLNGSEADPRALLKDALDEIESLTDIVESDDSRW